MQRYFNITANCRPKEHYMVDLTSRLEEIKQMIDKGQYFTINKGRQFGKTTTLRALEGYLSNDYIVISLDFQNEMSSQKFESEYIFSFTLARLFKRKLKLAQVLDNFKDEIQDLDETISVLKENFGLVELFQHMSDICAASEKPIVLIIDEVDSASNNQVFLDFLAQLRGYYINRDRRPTFQSVILAGVHDIRNLKQKIRPDAEHKHNSPWNIASEFKVEMSFLPVDIATMLTDYENDHHTGMDIADISQKIYDYTSGYPVLVSNICKLIDEDIHEWTAKGITQAVNIITEKRTPLLESLFNKIEDYPELDNIIRRLLFSGESTSFTIMDDTLNLAVMYGFIRNENRKAVIANKIFEKVLYERYLSQMDIDEPFYHKGADDKQQFIQNGRLNMARVLERFAVHFNDLYSDQSETFLEKDGRRLFLLYLRPIINGVGNYYIESETRNSRRTDVIVDYLGEQFIIEMKIWRGEEYNSRGEEQLSDYLDYYHISKGYMLSFSFNKSKEIGIHEITLGDKTIIEALV